MKAKFIIFASLLMCACSNEESQSISSDDLKADTPELATIKHYSLPLDELESGEDAAGTDRSGMNIPSAGHSPDGRSGTVTSRTDYTASEVSGIEELTSEAEGIHTDIIGVWVESFMPMYNDYGSHGTDVEVVAANIEHLHKTYHDLEIEVQNLKAPDYLSPEHMNTLNDLKSALQLAISNRTLAVIEFKLMNEKNNDIMHEELLNVHVDNSAEYLGHAAEHMDTLESLEEDAASSQQSELASSDE